MNGPSKLYIKGMHTFTCFASYCAILTWKLKYCHNFWTTCPIYNLFGYVTREHFAIYYRKQNFNWIEIEGCISFKKIDYAISQKLAVRLLNCFHQQIQRPWFQDKYLLNTENSEWVSYLFAQYIEFFYYKVYWTLGPRPVPTTRGIVLKIHTVHFLVFIIISWKFEVNPLRIDGYMSGR